MPNSILFDNTRFFCLDEVSALAPLEPPPYYNIADNMYQQRYSPRHRIRKINGPRRVIFRYLKHCRYPEYTQSARAEQRHYHRHYRVAQTAQHSHHNVHHTAQRVGRRNNRQTRHSGVNNYRAVGVYAEQRATEQKRRPPED